jgi:taurine dehydrogenase small subunit
MQTATDTANAELLSKFSDAFNSHNVGALMACMTEDCVFDAVGGSEVHGVRFEGQAAVAKAFEQVWINMPDAQ